MTLPTAQKIRSLFTPFSIQGHQSETLNLLADNVDWTIMGHSPMSRRYTSKQEFIDNTLKVLGERVLTEPLRLEVKNVIASNEYVGEFEKGTGKVKDEDGEIDGEVAVELEAIDAVCKNGLTYDMRYCWICKFDKGRIVKVRAYLDTDLLTRAMEQNP